MPIIMTENSNFIEHCKTFKTPKKARKMSFIELWGQENYGAAWKTIQQMPEEPEIPNPHVIKNKADYLTLWNRGALGNKMRSWSNYSEVVSSGYRGEFSMRTKQQSSGNSGGLAAYRLRFEDLERIMNEWIAKGVAYESIYFNESAPDEELVTQGEIMVTTDHYDYLYCNEPLKMREAMRKAKTMRGIAVVSYLKEVMMPNSWTDLNELFEYYPDSVIEFSVYQRTLGIYPNRNMIVWEVRNY